MIGNSQEGIVLFEFMIHVVSTRREQYKVFGPSIPHARLVSTLAFTSYK